MGNRRKKQRLVVTLVLLLTSVQFCFSQSTIKGIVKDSLDASVVFANVVLKDTTGKIITYAITENNGSFLLKTDKEGSFFLQISSLSYQTKRIDIDVIASNDYSFEVLLKPEFLILDEVVVQGSRPITVKKDTIVFDAQSFAQGNEEVVEDLLKKIPGLNIEGDGTIKVGNQEVEKVMVEGDDFFERGYKVLTKNMPSQPIDKVEVLQNYSNNRLLKGVEENDKVALNLKLKDDAKRVWFGNAKVGYDLTFNNLYEVKGNLMNFSKKNKYYFLTNLNNIGYDATGDINHLIRPFRFNEPASVGDNQSVEYLTQLNANPLNFKQSRTNFNNAELLSLNAIFNPSEKLKIKTLAFLNFDENQYFRNRIDNVDVNGINFTNTEDYKLNKSKSVFFGKADFTYNISKNQMLEGTSKFNYDTRTDKSNLLFNENPTNENLDNFNRLFDQKITYTNKLKERTTILLTGRFIDEIINQDYRINNYFFQDLFSSTDNVDNVRQTTSTQMTFAGFEAHLLNRGKKGHLLEFKFGNKYRKDDLNSRFTLLQEQTTIEEPVGFQNDFIYQTNDIYADSKYRYEIKNFALIGKMKLHQLFNQIVSYVITKSQTPFFINPGIGLDWKINDKNRLKTSYAFNATNLDLVDSYDNFILTDFRNFNQGTQDFNQLQASSALLNYQFGNWSDQFFANTFIIYSTNHDFLSTNTLLNPNFTLSENIIINDRQLFDVKTNFDYYIKKLSSNVRIELSFNQSNFKNIVNNSDLREVKNTNYRYGAEFRSAFNGIFNFNIGSKWTTNEITTIQSNSFTDNLSFLDISFAFNDRLDAQIQTERYYFGNLENDNTYYFLDFDVRYQFKENKLSFELNGKNLFNTERFRNFSVSDIGTSTTEYRLLPRFVLLKMEYRF